MAVQSAQLVFCGDYCYESDEIPNASIKDLADFVGLEESRDLMFSAGGTRPIRIHPKTPELLEFWKENCRECYGPEAEPAEEDILLVSSTLLQFPGLKMTNNVMNGVKTVATSKDNLVEYRAYLVAEMQETKGAPPVVWLYNKLTGADKRPKGQFCRSQAMGRSWISVVPKGKGYALKWDVQLNVKVEFPSALLKILPTSVEKMEEQGGSSVRKAVQTDVDLAASKVLEAFAAWQTSQPLASR